MYSKKKHRMDSEPLAKTNKLSSQGPTDKQDSNNNNNFHIEITPRAEELQYSITSSSKDIRERIISELDLDSDSNRYTETSKEHLKASINSIASNSKHLKVKKKNEKNFRDLNKSLAKLASRRVLGRSSSDNDAISYINKENANKSQFNFEFQVRQANSPQLKIATPSVGSKQEKNFFTSLKKENDITPISFYDRKAGRHFSYMDRQKRELGLSDVDYGKFIKGAYHRENRSQAFLSRPLKTESESYRRKSDWEQQSTARFRKPDYIMTEAQDIHDRDSFHENEDFNSRFRGINFAGDSDEKHQIIEMQYPEDEERKETFSHYTPSFKSIMRFGNSNRDYSLRGQKDKYNLKNLKFNNNLTGFRSDSDTHDTVPEHDHYEKLHLNNISDGVEYTMGGVGMKDSTAKKVNSRGGNSGSEDYGFISSKKFGKERLSGVQRETLDTWRHDIIKIKQDIERRQISYDELNRFTRMLEEDSPRYSKNPFAYDVNHGESYGGHSDKSEKHVNISKIDRVDHTSSNTPTLGSPSQALLTQMSHQERPAKRLSKDKRISFDFKTTDANDDGNTKSPLETKGDLPKPRAKGSNNEITETGEENASFVFAGKTYVERNEERMPCCSSTLGCNIF